MGRMLRVACEHCEKAWEIHVDAGLSHGALDAVLDNFSEETQTEARALAGSERFPVFHFSFLPAACPHCKAVVAVPMLRIKNRTWQGACPNCGGEATLLAGVEAPEKAAPDHTEKDSSAARAERGFPAVRTEQLYGCQCPNCGEKALRAQEIGLWD